jgi:hypothetical protein
MTVANTNLISNATGGSSTLVAALTVACAAFVVTLCWCVLLFCLLVHLQDLQACSSTIRMSEHQQTAQKLICSAFRAPCIRKPVQSTSIIVAICHASALLDVPLRPRRQHHHHLVLE